MALETGICSPADVLIRPGYRDDIEAAGRVLAAFNMPVPKNNPPSFLIEREGEVLAVGSVFYTASGCGWLANVAVAKNRRRQGLGRMIVQTCIEHAVRRRLPEVWLTTMFWNRPFYERLGFVFVPVPEVPATISGYRTEKKCMFMRLDLRSRIRKPPAAGRPGARVVVEA